ncbi:MAG TPA: ABC transporter ATP-binding protein, partial [Luteimonas sp.]|nr:ABC transporter ATP-binding protein [Luteimonas sp.]
LADYPGTLLLVSHDRDFLDRVVTSTLVMEGEGRVGEYVGGYSDWLRQRPASANPAPAKPAPAKPAPVEPTHGRLAQPPPPKRKLSYKDQRELDQLPARIEQLEAELAALTEAMHDPAFYQQDGAAITAHTQRLTDTQAALDTAYARWEALESQGQG